MELVHPRLPTSFDSHLIYEMQRVHNNRWYRNSQAEVTMMMVRVAFCLVTRCIVRCIDPALSATLATSDTAPLTLS